MIQVDTTLTKLEKLYDRKLQTSIKAFDFSTNLDIVCGFPKKYFLYQIKCRKSNKRSVSNKAVGVRKF